MTHYICTGECKMVSEDSSAVCSSPNCSRHTMKLEECNCEDGKHGRADSGEMENSPADSENAASEL